MQKQKPLKIHVPKFLEPEKILKQTNLNQNMIAADLGCGAGYMTFPAAKMVGNSGIVYAVDIKKEVLSSIRSYIQFYGARNVKPVLADVEILKATKIADNSVDLTMLVMNLYQSKKPDLILAESYRLTKPNGKLLVVEWKKQAIPFGPDVNKRIAYEVSRKYAQNAGFSFIQDLKTDPYHYGILFKK